VEHTLETYVCSYFNICNTRSFCNIKMKHTFETREMYGCKRLIDEELYVGAEFDARSDAEGGASPGARHEPRQWSQQADDMSGRGGQR
jgi:hypothetical protein